MQRKNPAARLSRRAIDEKPTQPRRRADATPAERDPKHERPEQTLTWRKPARADARAALDEAAWLDRVVGPFATIIRKAARVGDFEMLEERHAT